MTPYQPLNDSYASCSTLLQLLYGISTIRVHRTYRVEIIMKLHPQSDGILVWHIKGRLCIIPSSIFLIVCIEGKETHLPMFVLGMLERWQRSWEGSCSGWCFIRKGGESIICGCGRNGWGRDKVLDESDKPWDILQVSSVEHKEWVELNYRKCVNRETFWLLLQYRLVPCTHSSLPFSRRGHYNNAWPHTHARSH